MAADVVRVKYICKVLYNIENLYSFRYGTKNIMFNKIINLNTLFSEKVVKFKFSYFSLKKVSPISIWVPLTEAKTSKNPENNK